MDRLQLRAEDGEASAGVGRRVVQASVDAREAQLVAGADGVGLVARDDHLLRARHLARLHRAGRLLQGDLLAVPVERALPVHTPGALGLALDAGARPQLLLLRALEGATGEGALGAA